jgi:hypothetical protein
MFGSSQDRARQLAGRNRRQRISSLSSCTSSRSVSSSSQAPEQSPISILAPKASSAIEEHPSERKDSHIDPLAIAYAEAYVEAYGGRQCENAIQAPQQSLTSILGPKAPTSSRSVSTPIQAPYQNVISMMRSKASTSSRSVSSSSQAPRQGSTSILIPRASFAIEMSPSEHKEPHFDPFDLAEVCNGQQCENAIPVPAPLQVASGLPGPQVEQQRLQAEHLSQVLYSSPVSTASPPQSQFAPGRHTRYVSLGTIPTSHALRATASEYQLRFNEFMNMSQAHIVPGPHSPAMWPGHLLRSEQFVQPEPILKPSAPLRCDCSAF